MSSKNRGLNTAFTLIEMLIVIVIIGILAAALVPRLQSVQSRARDTKRKTDFLTIYNAMEIYKLDNGGYAHSGSDMRSLTVSAWLTQLTGILTKAPVDPINNSANTLTGGYSYRYRYSYPTSYHLGAQLENRDDPSRCELKNYVYAHQNGPIYGLGLCPSGSYPAWRYWYVYDPVNISRHQ